MVGLIFYIQNPRSGHNFVLTFYIEPFILFNDLIICKFNILYHYWAPFNPLNQHITTLKVDLVFKVVQIWCVYGLFVILINHELLLYPCNIIYNCSLMPRAMLVNVFSISGHFSGHCCLVLCSRFQVLVEIILFNFIIRLMKFVSKVWSETNLLRCYFLEPALRQGLRLGGAHCAFKKQVSIVGSSLNLTSFVISPKYQQKIAYNMENVCDGT